MQFYSSENINSIQYLNSKRRIVLKVAKGLSKFNGYVHEGSPIYKNLNLDFCLTLNLFDMNKGGP